MNTERRIRWGFRTATGIVGIAWSSLFWLPLVAGNVQAESVDDRWHISVPLYLAAGAHYYSSNKTGDSFTTVSAYAEALLSSHASPYSAGLFADYSLSVDGFSGAAISAGGLIEYQMHKWETNAYVFASMSQGASQWWLYAARVRYRVANNHKFGVEVAGTFGDSSASKLMFGYYGTISRSLSFNIVAGTSLISGHDRVARTDLVWQIN